MLAKDSVRELLAPFKIPISDQSIESLIVYLNLLLRWNLKINLTSITTPEECITRHFGESFLVSRKVQLSGRLLDIGSGAGFPGLALKLIAPQLEVVLLEPVAKKRAFLKEVARACAMGHVLVLGSRLDEFVRGEGKQTFDIVTVRAVGDLTSLVPQARGLLRSEGTLCLWLGAQQVRGIQAKGAGIKWSDPEAIPLSHDRVILVGSRVGYTNS
ncbi:MAG TPA: 16S rRNA (guanine(527)-N(7))-methyltransferase RsmG [Terriglobia bacterium]|nr:16S rRNA (guanine(527)-N(7))-methyltransferase RsmG [Terriglobia bacterium]